MRLLNHKYTHRVQRKKSGLSTIPAGYALLPGGKTPLAAGLAEGMEVLLQERQKNGEVIPMMVVISDGRANVPISGDVRPEILGIAGEIRSQGIRTVVIDTEETGNSFVGFRLGYCRAIAERAGGG